MCLCVIIGLILPHLKWRNCADMYVLVKEDIVYMQQGFPGFKQSACRGSHALISGVKHPLSSFSVPNKEPQELFVSDETQNSAQLFWKPIPYEHRRGFLTHYILCVKINSQNEGMDLMFRLILHGCFKNINLFFWCF